MHSPPPPNPQPSASRSGFDPTFRLALAHLGAPSPAFLPAGGVGGGLGALSRPLERWEIPPRELSRTTGITIAPAKAGRGILPRVLSVLAARANFSTDRICDVQLLADALTARAPQSPAGDRISLAVITGRRTLQLTLGPLAAGNARVLVDQSEVEGLGSVIEKLSDEQRVSADGGGEHLVLRMLDKDARVPGSQRAQRQLEGSAPGDHREADAVARRRPGRSG